MKDEQWIAELRRRMAEHEHPAPDGLWESIETTMSESGGHTMTPLRRRHLIWRYASAVAAIVLLVFLFGDNLTHFVQPLSEHPISKPTLSEQIYITDNVPAVSGSNILHAATPSSVDSHDTRLNTRRISAQPVLSLTHQPITETPPSAPTPIAQDAAAEYADVSVKTPEPESHKDHLPEEKSVPTLRNAIKSGTTLLAVTRTSNKKTGNLSAGISVSNLPRVTTNSRGYSGLVARYATTNAGGNHELPEAGNPLCELMLNNLDKEINTDTKHYQPIKVGISICYSLTDRLDLESGLTYAHLVSSTTSGSNDYRFETKQKLHYIGIPLGVNYDLIQNRRFSLYVSTGVSVEICVAGQIDTDYINSGTVTKSDREHFRPKELQWSANIGAGAQYNITPGIGLYAEPGMSYYFSNDGSRETFYTQKPLKFSMEAGIRFSFPGK